MDIPDGYVMYDVLEGTWLYQDFETGTYGWTEDYTKGCYVIKVSENIEREELEIRSVLRYGIADKFVCLEKLTAKGYLLVPVDRKWFPDFSCAIELSVYVDDRLVG